MKSPKLADLVVDELKRRIARQDLKPGDQLAKEAELQSLFAVSKATTREALKSLEVQGLISIGTGPKGGAKVERVPFAAAFQQLQSYLYFTDLTAPDLYGVRALIEPELVAGAIAHLTKEDIAALEHSIAICASPPRDVEHATKQRQEDLAFHAIIARAHPNPLLRFMVEFVNEALRQLVVRSPAVTAPGNRRFGQTTVHAHRDILDAIKSRQPARARDLMRKHNAEVASQMARLHTTLARRLVLDSDMEGTNHGSERRKS